MNPLIVDSSVAIKWYVPEVLSAEALRLYHGSASLHAPEFLDVEVASIVWKKRLRGQMSRTAADQVLDDLKAAHPVIRYRIGPLVVPAFDLAERTGRTVYDCLYLALAVRLGGVMVTADERLVNALAGGPWAAHTLKLQNVP